MVRLFCFKFYCLEVRFRKKRTFNAAFASLSGETPRYVNIFPTI
ncbi:hypothetical protein BFV94_3007 [Alteromonas macleodii]|uniref:Uncharacterized protein n=1 Tax=Alteromonas macleodii TaxID=28108 RepID=A0AB36FPL7_ALTMA|nr:hypothetical protein BFV93_2995 [Alteromonas macleodii]OES29716.1 hypothetical protein BFV94_3007 [Alteromonas macleodii]OES30348.1 hypothetical protein BFV95_3007 [Alteromonas macleodii]OES40570.1 hypothetical protein BFV96_2992 [Alteromonas macleodii]